jgi:hypothetical protein
LTGILGFDLHSLSPNSPFIDFELEAQELLPSKIESSRPSVKLREYGTQG